MKSRTPNQKEAMYKFVSCCKIAVILQHEIQNSKTKIYIVSFQMALELGYLRGGYVNFWFCCSGLDHCNLQPDVLQSTVVDKW